MKRKKRSDDRLAGIVLVLVLMLTVLAFVILKSVFVVREIRVVGVAEADQTEVIRAGWVGLGGSIFAVDSEKVRENINATGTFACDDVRTELPSTIVVTARRRNRDGMALSGGNVVVMDAEGYVIEVTPEVPQESSVYVTGLEGFTYRIGGRISVGEDRLEAMASVLGALRTANALDGVAQLNVSDVRNLSLLMRNGLTVKLGNASDMTEKVRWLVSAATDLDARGETGGELDVSSGTKADYKPPAGNAQAAG